MNPVARFILRFVLLAALFTFAINVNFGGPADVKSSEQASFGMEGIPLSHPVNLPNAGFTPSVEDATVDGNLLALIPLSIVR